MLRKLLQSKSNSSDVEFDGLNKDIQLFAAEAPIVCLVGSLIATKKADALAYARGQVESLLIAKDVSRLNVLKGTDGRWYYEIHEGGLGRSVLPWVIKSMEINPKAKIELPLAGCRTAIITQYDDEIVTVIAPPDEKRYEAAIQGVADFQLGEMLPEFYGTAVLQRNAAVAVFCVSLVFLLVSGILAFIKGNVIDPEGFTSAFAAANPSKRTETGQLPSFQLDLAVKNITMKSGYLSYLKLENGRWTWAQATAESPVNAQGAGK